MIYTGIAKSKVIELDDALPYPEGQPVNVSVEPADDALPLGSPASILRAMSEPPHLDPEDVDELLRVIKEGRLRTRYEGVFDDERNEQ
jgi:hypothetical protein